MLSSGFKPGEPWAEQRRDLERAFNDSPGHAGRMSSRSVSSGFPSGSPHQAVQRQYSTSSAGPIASYARHSGYGTGYHDLPRANYGSPGRTDPQDPWMQYRDASQRSSPSSSGSHAHGRSYTGHAYAPAAASSYTLQSRSGSSRYSRYGYGHSGSESSLGYAPRSGYYSDDADDEYTQAHAPSSIAESDEPHYASSGYAETNFVVEPSDSGSEASYSGNDSLYDDSADSGSVSGSGYSSSEGDSVYSDEEYEDYEDDGAYSDDGGYYSDD